MLLKLNLLVFFYFIFLSAFAQTPVCNTWTFQVQLGSSRIEIPSDVIALPDGYLVGGKDSSTAGVFGRLIRLDQQGKVVVSKEVKMGSEVMEIKKLRFISNTIFALGELTDSSGKVTPVLMTIDAATLNVLSSITINPSVGSWHPAAFDAGEANTVTILSYNDSMINVTRLAVEGNVVWSKSYKTGTKPHPVAIVNNHTDCYIAYNTVDAGMQKGVVMRMDKNGVQYSNTMVGGGAGNMEYVLHSMQLVLGMIQITGVVSKGGNALPIRFTVAPNNILISSEGDFSFSTFSPALPLLTGLSDWSEVIAAGMPNSSSLYLAFTFPLNYNSPITAKKISYLYPVTFKQIIRTADAGSLILAKKADDGGKMVLTKIDSSGALTGCGSDIVAASFTNVATETEQITLAVVDEAVHVTSVQLVSTDLPVTEMVDCRSLACPLIPQPPVCQKTFFKKYDNQSHSAFPRQIINAGNGNLLVTADYRANPYISNDVTSLSLFDTSGNVLKSINLNGNDFMYLDKITRLSDGSYMGVGSFAINSPSPHPLGVIKLDAELNLLWQKKLNFLVPYQGFFDILESSEGDVYCYLRDVFSNIPEKRQLLKIDRYGNPVWFKEYDAGPSLFYGTDQQFGWLVDMGDYIYMNYHPESDWSPHILKISKSDGSIVWDRQYSLTSFLNSNVNIQVQSFFSGGNNLYMAVLSGTKNVLLKVNPVDGSVVSSVFKPSSDVSVTAMTYGGNGKVVISVYAGTGKIYGVVKMDTAFRQLQQQFLQLPIVGVIRDITNYDDSINFAVGQGNSPGNPYASYLSLQKYNFESSFTSCQVSDPALSFKAITVPVVNGPATVTSLALPSAGLLNLATTSGNLQYGAYYCGNQPLCSSVTISGPAAICDSGTYHYSALKNPGCDAHVNWAVSGSADSVEMMSITDTSVDLYVKKAGNYHLRAKIYGSCEWIGDSMQISASLQAPKSLELGRDTTLCEGNHLILNAGGGFSSYQWQDGSTDTSFTVTTAGTYFITARAGCNREFSDTVVVAPHAAIPFALEADTSICEGDAITLRAPDGFTNYQWTPGNSSQATQAVHPLSDTWYTVHADAEAGCSVSDSIFVAVKKVPAIHLGNDTSFCAGQFLTLDAGEGFDSYQWHTGESSRMIIAAGAGLYMVTGFLNGCSSQDSMQIVVHPLPSFSLGPDTTLCEGQALSYILKLENAAYLWNTGSTSGSLTIANAGSYWLTVDQNGCSASDTVTVKSQPAPVVHLGSDTTICEGTNLTLSAENSNATYLWQNGSTNPQFSVTSAGTYYVITAIGSCRSSDTVQVNVSPLPRFVMSADKYICMGQPLVLTPAVNTNVSYLWPDGSSMQSYIVTKEGTYSLTVSNSCGNFTDSVTINLGLCNLMMPNAFTPNNDGLNDLFRVKYPFAVQSFFLRVFDRFGEIVFESRDINKGWDGTFKGVPALQGAYAWTIRMLTPEGKPQTSKGVVTLLR